MLRVVIPGAEAWDPVKEEFVSIKETTLILEHSLLSISKWESKWKTSFLEAEDLSGDKLRDYIMCMTINHVQDNNVYYMIPNDVVQKIVAYIKDPMTATNIYHNDKKKKKGPHKTITSERIYYWLTAYNIPFETEKWHLNRLLSLIDICSEENAPKEKMSKQELFARNARLNAERRAKLHTKG